MWAETMPTHSPVAVVSGTLWQALLPAARMARRAGSLNTGSLSTSRTVTWATSRAAWAQAVPSSPTWSKKSTKSAVSPVCSSMRRPPRARSASWTLPMSVPVTDRVLLSTAFRTAPRLPDPDRWAEVKVRAGSDSRTRRGNHSGSRPSGRGVVTSTPTSVRSLTL